MSLLRCRIFPLRALETLMMAMVFWIPATNNFPTTGTMRTVRIDLFVRKASSLQQLKFFREYHVIDA
ncbi:unnamed protein product [Phytomonas sp. EM1]|nr:unnamed protein product [Phytomonas sp. EM1]|eukprot:CCW62828.1 unnamed protein product [Phytomonas sp. isolate EM1]